MVRWGWRGAVLALVMAMVAGVATPVAHADAGAPDPSFGTRGIAWIPTAPTRAFTETSPRGAVLVAGRILVPEIVTRHRLVKGRPGTTTRSIRFLRLDDAGAAAGRTKAVALPSDLESPSVVPDPTGHLLVVGIHGQEATATPSLYVLRLTVDGDPAPTLAGASASIDVPLRSIPNLGSSPRYTLLMDVAVGSSGRVFVALRQVRYHPNPSPGIFAGPVVVAAIDPSVGPVTSFASGGLVVAPATDERGSSSVDMVVDAGGSLYVLAHTTRSAIAGTTHELGIVRYAASGVVDSTFAGGRIDLVGGRTTIAYGEFPTLALLRNGDLVTRVDYVEEAGTTLVSGIDVRRFTADGQPVATFGESGTARLQLQRTPNRFGQSGSGFGRGAGAGLFEQPDGKLLLGVSAASSTGRPPIYDGIMRITAGGALDDTFERRGVARYDAPGNGFRSGWTVGLDAAGRVIASIQTSDERGARSGVLRLLSGDEPARAAAASMRIDGRPCGASRARACFDSDGNIRITGDVTAGGTGVVGATVVVSIERPSGGVSASGPTLQARTTADGTFSVRAGRAQLLPGSWVVSARVLATRSSQRIDTVPPRHVVLGPRRDIAQLQAVYRAQALAVALDVIVDETIGYNNADMPRSQCMSNVACFGRSPRIQRLVSQTQHPEPNRAGLIVRRPGQYSIITRPAILGQRLEFVITQTPDDTLFRCRGDRAALRRWCPTGTWDDIFEDAFITARIDGSPFGW